MIATHPRNNFFGRHPSFVVCVGPVSEELRAGGKRGSIELLEVVACQHQHVVRSIFLFGWEFSGPHVISDVKLFLEVENKITLPQCTE